MYVGTAKQITMTERAVRVLELYHQGHTYREIAQKVSEEGKGRKSWKITHTTARSDVKRAIEYHRQQAVDYYADWLARELSLAEHGHKMAIRAYEESRTIKKERTSLAGSGAASEETTTKAPDADLSREVREWQNQRLKLLGVVRETSKAPDTLDTAAHEQTDDLAPYAQSVEQFAASVVAGGHGNVQPDRAAKPVPAPQTHPAPS